MMTYQELLDHNKKRCIKQLAFLTTDLDETIRKFVDLLKIGPWKICSYCNETLPDFEVDGKKVEEPFEFLIALSDVGDLNIEVMQPVKGPNVYWRHLEKYGQGLHHFKEWIKDEDFPAYLAELKEKGMDVIQKGWCSADLHAYINTMPFLNFNYELGNCPPDIDIPEKFVRYYPEKD